MKAYSSTECERLSKADLDTLVYLCENHFEGQRILAERIGHSLGAVNKAINNLNKKGYIDEEMKLTLQAKELINSRQPRNAIILAAGFGMRMVPINMSTPKAFLEVKGERLIERIIKQLNEVGVYDITIVVGFMKDAFEYLIDEYGAKLKYASGYASTNNLHSIKVVADQISNTYIVPSDVYCVNNPFRKRETYSWYMVSDACDSKSDVRTNRKRELIKVGSHNTGNKMIGISYLTDDVSDSVKDRINVLCASANSESKFWEEALYENDKMVVYARVVLGEDAIEINTYEQLREVDASSNHLKNDAMQTICKTLDCQENEITKIEILKKGMTNRSFSFCIKNGANSGKYIMRIPGEGTDQLIDRYAESQVYETIKGLMLCDDPLYINPRNGYKITKFIDGVRCCEAYNEEDVRACMKKLRKFHSYKKNGKSLAVPHTFDIYERIDFYEKLWDGEASIYRDYEKTKENCKKLRRFIEKTKEPMQLTHIDAVPDNFLFDPNEKGELSIQLTDWEYAGMQDKHVDLAMFAIYAMYDKDWIDKLINIYFEEEGGCDTLTRAKIYCYISICGLTWSNWCEYKRNLGVDFGEYSICQYRYAKDYYRYACELMKEIGEQV